MRIRPVLCLLLALAACQMPHGNSGPAPVAQFWRPISAPNVEMPMDKLQHKLEFDLGQCHCGSWPANMPRDEGVEFQADKQRLAETGATVVPNEEGQCVQHPSLVVRECMRQRGWEPTSCSGRMPTAAGGSLCTTYPVTQ